MNFHHGKLDHVGSSALNGGVNSISFCIAANRKVGGVHITQPALAPHYSLNITMLSRIIDHIIHVPGDAGKFLFIIVNDGLCLCSADAKIFCQSECSLSI